MNFYASARGQLLALSLIPKSIFEIRLLYLPIGVVRVSSDYSTIISLLPKPRNHLAIVFSDTSRLGIKIIPDQQNSLLHLIKSSLKPNAIKHHYSNECLNNPKRQHYL